jgi:hypothetical protein
MTEVAISYPQQRSMRPSPASRAQAADTAVAGTAAADKAVADTAVGAVEGAAGAIE